MPRSFLIVGSTFLFIGACTVGDTTPNQNAKPDAGSGTTDSTLTLRFFNVANETIDGRYQQLPSTMPWAELLPNITLEASVPDNTATVRFTLDGETYDDSEAPFRWSEDETGTATTWMLNGPGSHHLQIKALDSSGEWMAEKVYDFEFTAAGLDPTPDDGEHSIHRMWLTGSGVYVHRDANGNFVDQNGTTILAAADVTLEIRGNDEGHLIARDGAPDTIAFAFIVLLPDGYDASVTYPLIVFLHHGASFYRGTDNEGRQLDTPLFNGPNSITQSIQRHQFPAIILMPQMVASETIAGVTHEWAAFTSIDNNVGTSNSAPAPSRNAQYVLDVVSDLTKGNLVINGAATTVDESRLYLTGHSMGGLGTWDLAARFPDYWAAVAPMAGYPDHSRAGVLINTPIWAFHHRIDSYNPYVGSETMERLIREAGGTMMRLTSLEFDTGGAGDQAHFQTPNNAWNPNNELLAWLFSQAN